MGVGIQVKINGVFCKAVLWHNVCVIETDMSSHKATKYNQNHLRKVVIYVSIHEIIFIKKHYIFHISKEFIGFYVPDFTAVFPVFLCVLTCRLENLTV